LKPLKIETFIQGGIFFKAKQLLIWDSKPEPINFLSLAKSYT
jgi:hypothetical protein